VFAYQVSNRKNELNDENVISSASTEKDNNILQYNFEKPLVSGGATRNSSLIAS